MNNDNNIRSGKTPSLVSNSINLNSFNIQSINASDIYYGTRNVLYRDQSHSSVINQVQTQQKLLINNHKKEMPINIDLLERFLNNKLTQLGLKKNDVNNEIKIAIMKCIETYLRNRFDEMIKMTRARNINFDRYSKILEKRDFIGVKCYHKDNPQKPMKFDLTMFPNDKDKLARLEQYEELIACKERFDKKVKRIILGKQLENQINNTKKEENQEEDAEGQINSTSKNTITINFANKNPRGRPQTRLKDSSQLKIVRKENNHLKLKESEYNRKQRHEDTIDIVAQKFKPKNQDITDFEDYASKQGDNFITENKDDTNSKDINLIVHTKHKYTLGFPLQYRITLKDYYLYLERRVKFTYQQKLLLKVYAKLITNS